MNFSYSFVALIEIHMNKIIDRLKQYYEKKSKLSLVFDIFFYLLLLLIIIPGTRTKVVSTIKRITLIPPLGLNATSEVEISSTDYLWSFQDMNEKTVSLEHLKGDIIFLNFWATWCPPCIAEMPSIQKLYDTYGDKIKMILVSQEDPKTIKAFLEKNQYSMPTYILTNPIPEIFQSKSIPSTFLISPEGQLILKKKGAAKWDSKKVTKLLDKMIAEKKNE